MITFSQKEANNNHEVSFLHVSLWENHITFCFPVPAGHRKYAFGGSGPFYLIPYKKEI